MAGMFYSSQEAAEKLNKTETELKQLVKDGKLREFRDGPNLLFKVEEVEALMSDTGIMGLEELLEPEVPEPEAPALEILEPETTEPEMLAPEALEPEIPAVEEAPELEMPSPEALEAEIPAVEEVLEPEMPAPEAIEPEMPAPEIPEPEEAAAETPVPEVPAPSEADIDEILLAPETGAPVVPSELTDADTALTGAGTSVLGETDRDYEVTDDTMAETALPAGTTGTTPEMQLEEIEEDVNLDSFGSGSGLLDLSLQADDTSLGGILDEIYTAEEEGKEPAEPEADSAAAVAAEAEQMVSEEDLVGPQPTAEVPALARPYIEVAPDVQSNTLGILLFLPLAIIIYTTVVAVAGLRGVLPSILEHVQGLIWYIMAGLGVVALLVVGAAFMLTGERGTATKKEKKPKKPKEPQKAKKPKKPKKAKKGKKGTASVPEDTTA